MNNYIKKASRFERSVFFRSLKHNKFAKSLSRLINSKEGVGAVEFALIVPFLLILYVGALEVSVAMSVDKKVSKATAIATDIITQSTTTDKASLTEMLGVAKSVIAPFNADALNMQIVGIRVDAAGDPTVAWSWDEGNNRPFTVGVPITIPTAFKIPETFVIQAILDMDYDLLMLVPKDDDNETGFIKRSINLEKLYYLHQREAEEITCSNC